MNNTEKQQIWSMLESKDFDYLLDAVALMAKAQEDLINLRKSIDDLRDMMNDSCDELSMQDNIVIYDIVDDVDNIVADLSAKDSVLKGI